MISEAAFAAFCGKQAVRRLGKVARCRRESSYLQSLVIGHIGLKDVNIVESLNGSLKVVGRGRVAHYSEHDRIGPGSLNRQIEYTSITEKTRQHSLAGGHTRGQCLEKLR